MSRKPQWLDETEFIFTYAGIAYEIGVSESTLKRFVKRYGYKLSQWTPGKTGTVYLSIYGIATLKRLYLRSKLRKDGQSLLV